MQMTRKEEEKLLEDIMFIDSQQLQILQANPTSRSYKQILQALSYKLYPSPRPQRHSGTGPWWLANGQVAR